MIGWQIPGIKLERLKNGVFEVFLPGGDALSNGCHVKTIIKNGEKTLERIPLYIRRVEQDKDTYIWCGVIGDEPEYKWKKKKFLNYTKMKQFLKTVITAKKY